MRKYELWKYVNSLYVPKCRQEDYANLLHIIRENDYRGIESRDNETIHKDSLIIYSAGRGACETFHGYRIARIDIAKVSPIEKGFADIAILNEDGLTFTPVRVRKDSIKINILNQ